MWSGRERSPTVTVATAAKIALVLSLAVILLGSVRFGRIDWTGIPFERNTETVERVVSDDCTEVIRPYRTEGGRVIEPVTVDEQQYLSLVAYFRGTPRSELHVTCLLDPFAGRPAIPWLASWLPFDEGVSIGLVNLSMVLLGTWATVFALRSQGFSGRVVALVAALFAVGWNTLFFSSAILVDAGAVGLTALSWYLLASRRPWLVWPVLLVSYPFKETVALVVLPVMAAWAWGEHRSGRLSGAAAGWPTLAAAVAAGCSVVSSRLLFLSADATWELAPNVGTFVDNVSDPIGIASFLLATLWLFVPALLVVGQRIREAGWKQTALDPAVVGIAMTGALCLWVTPAADLSPRFAWLGFPFAASLAAVWFSEGRPQKWLDGLHLPPRLSAQLD
ncbi:MAG: hypothetical protein JJLCMIEE_00854 [Acidimicrobiales bacterium]|nr:hypothetical protein [Acidimicrobiales bacterium]